MKERQLGKNGPTVSALGLGCMGMSQAYGPGNDEESVRTIDRALERGVTFFDTADVYGRGANEILVGGAIKARRKNIVLATKCGIVNTAGGPLAVNGRPEYVREACDSSLKRLQVDVIDLYYLHRVDPATPIEDTIGAMAGLVKDGKVRFIGMSEVAASNLRRAYAVHPITAVQSEYSLWYRAPESGVLPVCRELGIAFVPFSPLGRGFLSNREIDVDTLAADDMRRRVPRFQEGHRERNAALLQALQKMAASKGCTPAQLALAWLLAKGDDIVPIPGTKRRRYLDENVEAAEIVLSGEDVASLERVFTPDAASGERYPAEMERLVDRG